MNSPPRRRAGRPRSSAADTPPVAAPSDAAISQALGQRIKALRARNRLTLEQLSQRSGVSRAMLSTIERGEKSPTLPIIVRIAAGFGLTLSSLLGAEPDPSHVAIIRAAQRLSFRDPQTGFERWVLSPTHVDDGLEFVLHRLPPGRSTGPLPAYTGSTQKYLAVNTGTLTVLLDGQPHVLEAGDAMYFDVKAPYHFVNENQRTECLYYMVIARKR